MKCVLQCVCHEMCACVPCYLYLIMYHISPDVRTEKNFARMNLSVHVEDDEPEELSKSHFAHEEGDEAKLDIQEAYDVKV